MTEPTTLLDAISPPPGYRFARGAWLTHDLSIAAVNTLVAPALLGYGVNDHAGGLLAQAGLPADCLTIAAAGDRITPNALVPGDRISVMPVVRRRQHAKAAVLCFEAMKGHRGAQSMILTLVMSANLTRPGLTRNREALFAEWLPSNARTPTISRAVLAAMRALKPDLITTSQRHKWRGQLDWLTARISKQAPDAVGQVAESITGPVDLVRNLLAPVIDPSTVARVALIGPAFAADTSPVAADLTWMLRPGVRVDLVVDTSLTEAELKAGRKVSVPAELRKALARKVGADHLIIHGAATDEKHLRVDRRLHAKAIIVETTEHTWTVAGSANLTVRGLQGKNRELVVLRQGSNGELAAALRAVHAVPTRKTMNVGDATEELMPTVAASKVALMATFVPAKGEVAVNGAIYGSILVQGLSGQTTVELANGKRVKLVDGRADDVLLDQEDTCIYIGGRAVVITLSTPNADEFWSGVSDVDGRGRLAARELADLEHDATVASMRRSGKKKASLVNNDGFAIPLDNALHVIARRHAYLADWPEQRRADLFDQYFPDGGTEREIADAIVTAGRSTSNAKLKPLLKALQHALASQSKGQG